MKWFKHFTDNHRGQSVNKLLDEMGYFGPFLYFTIYELCAEKLDKFEDRELTQDDCIFRFHRRVICSATRAKPSTVGRGMVLGQSCKLWSFKIDGNYIEIFVPILLELLEYDQKKSRQQRAEKAPRKRLEKEKETEAEEEKEKIKIQNYSVSTRQDIPTTPTVKKLGLAPPDLNACENFETQMSPDFHELKQAVVDAGIFASRDRGVFNNLLPRAMKHFGSKEEVLDFLNEVASRRKFKEAKSTSEKSGYVVRALEKAMG